MLRHNCYVAWSTLAVQLSKGGTNAAGRQTFLVTMYSPTIQYQALDTLSGRGSRSKCYNHWPWVTLSRAKQGIVPSMTELSSRQQKIMPWGFTLENSGESLRHHGRLEYQALDTLSGRGSRSKCYNHWPWVALSRAKQGIVPSMTELSSRQQKIMPWGFTLENSGESLRHPGRLEYQALDTLSGRGSRSKCYNHWPWVALSRAKQGIVPSMTELSVDNRRLCLEASRWKILGNPWGIMADYVWECLKASYVVNELIISLKF